MTTNQFACVAKAQNIFIRQRTDEMMSSDMGRMSAFLYYASLHPNRASIAFNNAINNAQVKYMLEMDDCLRKACECIADDEWHNHTPMREAA